MLLDVAPCCHSAATLLRHADATPCHTLLMLMLAFCCLMPREPPFDTMAAPARYAAASSAICYAAAMIRHDAMILRLRHHDET